MKYALEVGDLYAKKAGHHYPFVNFFWQKWFKMFDAVHFSSAVEYFDSCSSALCICVDCVENPDLLEAQKIKDENLHSRLSGMVVNPDKVGEVCSLTGTLTP